MDPELKILTETHIQNQYPPTEWLRIYTDGSVSPGKGLAGTVVATCLTWPSLLVSWDITMMVRLQLSLQL
jgi:hypothetical protein